MTKIKVLLVPALLALLVSGCAGTDFKRPDSGALQLGKSTEADLVRIMGQPRQTGELVKNNSHIRQLTYVYATKIGSDPIYPGVTPARAMVLSTFGDVLVGEQFMSSFKEDGTDFDSSKVPAIIKGKSTKADVIGLLGTAPGNSIYPLVNGKDDTSVVYAYAQTTGGAFNLKFYHKILTVSFDKDNVVTNVEYLEGGNK